jgi:hypothetical protein
VTLVVPWLGLPLLFAAVALGTGLLVERLGAHRIPVPLLFGVGFAGMVCLSQVLVRVLPDATPYVVVAVGLAGLVSSFGRLRGATLDRTAALMALAVFGLYAAPVVLTGEATFLGYGNLGDAGFHFALVDALMAHGYDVGELPYSSFSGTVQSYYDTSYPTGAHTVLGSLRAFTGTDVAWLLQPYLTCLVAASALGLYALVGGRTRWTVAAAAGIAASAGLVYAYANNQQALKELAALLCIVTATGIVRPLVAAPASWRAAIPAAVTAAGALGVLSLAVAPWVGSLALVAVVALVLRHRGRRAAVALQSLAFAVVAGVLALPALIELGTFVQVTNTALTGAQELGNLTRPLPFTEALGVWPAVDFRQALPGGPLASGLVVLVAVAAALGLLLAVRDRRFGVLLFAAVSAVGFLAVAGRASPWAYAKALMLLSPALVLLAGALAVGLHDAGRRRAAVVLLAVLGAGVLWTDARTYHGASPAPRERLQELASIGERFADEGPLGYFEYEEFAKHFLRDAAPSGQSEAYRLPGPAYVPGKGLRFGYSTDTDDFVPASLLDTFRLLVVRRGPLTSRPVAGWTRAFSGRYYDVYRREAQPPETGDFLPLGTPLDAASGAPCDRVRALARTGDRIAYVPRQPVQAFRVDRVRRPLGWGQLPDEPEVLVQNGPGLLEGQVTVPAGAYDVWLEGSVQRPAEVRLDGRVVGSVGGALAQRPTQLHVGGVRLAEGSHPAAVEVGGGSLAPGNGGLNRLVGPVLLAPARDPGAAPVRTVAASRWRSVCGQHADWVLALR